MYVVGSRLPLGSDRIQAQGHYRKMSLASAEGIGFVAFGQSDADRGTWLATGTWHGEEVDHHRMAQGLQVQDRIGTADVAYRGSRMAGSG